MAAQANDGWQDVSHELSAHGNDGWQDVSHELKSGKSWLDTETPWGSDVRGLVKGTLHSLPLAGTILGGTGGFFGGGPGGAIAGAGLLGAGGKALQNLGEKYILGEDKNTSDVYTQPVIQALDSAGQEMAGLSIPGMGKAIAESPIGKKVGGLIKSGASKVGEMLTGVPEKEIQTYAQNAPEIKAMAKASDNNLSEAADTLRKKWDAGIQETKNTINSQISNALKNNESFVDLAPITKALEESKASINPKLYPEQIAQIDDMANKVSSLANDGKLSLSDANDVKRFLQNKASSAYRNNGDIFNIGTEAAKSAKSGAAVTRGILNKASPEIEAANNQLANLHDVEDGMNLNLLREGKPESSILAAGSGANPRNAGALEDLGKFTGNDMLGDAQKLAAMRTFGSPKLMAADSTGKAVGRMAIGGGIGYILGDKPGMYAGAALSSPMALRTVIDAGLLTKEALSNPQVQQMIGMGGKGLLKDAIEKVTEHENMPDDQKGLLEKLAKEKMQKMELDRTSGGDR